LPQEMSKMTINSGEKRKEFMTGTTFEELKIDSATKRALREVLKYPNLT